MSYTPPAPENRRPDTSDGRWTDIEILPEWSEEFYDVYTARKHGRWVMLKALKPEFAKQRRYIDMIGKEFDVRYNLSHPNIVMINDLEDIEGIGRAIICDDVYGKSLHDLLTAGQLTDNHYRQLCTRLPMAMEYIQQNHLAHKPLSTHNIIFTDEIGNLKLIDVGYDQRRALSHADTSGDIKDFGNIMTQVLEGTGRHDPRMHHIARRASHGTYHDVQALQMAISGRSNTRIYAAIIVILVCLCAILAWLVAIAPPRPL